MPTLEDIKAQIKGYIAEDDFEKAIGLFRQYVHDDARLESDLILQQAQYNAVMRSFRNGTASSDQTDRSLARIRAALLDLANRLKPEDLAPDALPAAPDLTVLQTAEQQGIAQQLELAIRRLNALRESIAIQYDPNIRFALENQMAALEKEVLTLQAKFK